MQILPIDIPFLECTLNHPLPLGIKKMLATKNSEKTKSSYLRADFHAKANKK